MQKPIGAAMIMASLMIHGCGSESEQIGGSGLIEADEVIVSSETSGRVDSLCFIEGQPVKKLDTLAFIDPSRRQLELASAEASYLVTKQKLKSAAIQEEQAQETEEYALKERDRVAALVKSGGATPKELDLFEFEYSRAVLNRNSAAAAIETIESELKKLDADIGRIKREIRDCYPTSPLTGIILEKLVEKGEVLVLGKPIAKIAGLDTVWVKIYVSSGDLASLKIGDEAVIDTETGAASGSGVVVWTSNEAEFTPKNVQTKDARANLVFAVKIIIPNDDGLLKIGMPVYVTFNR
jgi:HlyD family secretion protein